MLRMSYLIFKFRSVKTVPLGKSVGMMFLSVHVKVAPVATDVPLDEVTIDEVDTVDCGPSVVLVVDTVKIDVDDPVFEVAPSEVEEGVDTAFTPVKLRVELACDPGEETVVVGDSSDAMNEVEDEDQLEPSAASQPMGVPFEMLANTASATSRIRLEFIILKEICWSAFEDR
jgi:hypothetical protein